MNYDDGDATIDSLRHKHANYRLSQLMTQARNFAPGQAAIWRQSLADTGASFIGTAG
jgi:hypothetical protein